MAVTLHSGIVRNLTASNIYQRARDSLRRCHRGFDVPCRALVPQKIDNILLAGRCISCEQVAFQSTREMAELMAFSEAGTAAALAVKYNVTTKQLDEKLLQKLLLKNNVELRLDPNKVEEE